ncbi:MAG TPA: CpsD/CapB family tyrosine-protein kinase [Pyrinomonadaceae bacterium]|jgi:capsular exopolysaccharide synthesis family protein|nr:CpsD/CapB family tyrosine-protein kinase [Pyrinomonadaceae bacterium]
MGRIYDALKRAESAQRPSSSKSTFRQNGNSDNVSMFVPRNGQEHPWERSAFTGMPSAFDSASTAHTTEATDGPALPGGPASRDAGATLGAVGSARAVKFSTREVLTARVEPHLIAITEPRSPECEQFRALRTRLLQAGEREQKRAFVITSAGMGEGKTLTALNLAWLLAQTDGATALLIDADLRRPCAAEYLGLETEFGLSEVLTGETKLTQAILKLRPSGLHLLPGGAAREDVAELLSGPRFGRLLDEARKLFDYIIIDAPPLGVFTDANLLVNRADAAILVVRASVTRYSVVDRLLEQLPRERMLGVVLNRAETKPEDTSYYYQPRLQRVTAKSVAEAKPGGEPEFEPEMIYIEEEGVS